MLVTVSDHWFCVSCQLSTKSVPLNIAMCFCLQTEVNGCLQLRSTAVAINKSGCYMATSQAL